MLAHLPTLANPLKDLMTSKTIYHYVYRITNTVENKHYYGKRSSKCDPKEDIGKKYFSSSSDKEFRADQKLNPQNYRYKIVKLFAAAQLAIIRESELHRKFDVGANPKFYNRTKQTPRGFDSTGTKISDEKRAKLSRVHLGIMHSEETKSKMSVAHKGKIKTPEHIENARLGSINAMKLKPRKPSRETIEKQIKSNTGKKRSPEQCKRISESQVGKKRSDSFKEKRRIMMIGENNKFFLGYYQTPNGIFASRNELEELKMCKQWCTHSSKLINKLSYAKSKYLNQNYSWEFLNGKSFVDIGFGFLPK